jgi:hypothetical protein
MVFVLGGGLGVAFGCCVVFLYVCNCMYVRDKGGG